MRLTVKKRRFCTLSYINFIVESLVFFFIVVKAHLLIQGQDGNKSVGNLEITMEPSHELIQEEKDETPKNKENDTETPEGVIKENEEDERETEKSKIEVSLTKDLRPLVFF